MKFCARSWFSPSLTPKIRLSLAATDHFPRPEKSFEGYSETSQKRASARLAKHVSLLVYCHLVLTTVKKNVTVCDAGSQEVPCSMGARSMQTITVIIVYGIDDRASGRKPCGKLMIIPLSPSCLNVRSCRSASSRRAKFPSLTRSAPSAPASVTETA